MVKSYVKEAMPRVKIETTTFLRLRYPLKVSVLFWAANWLVLIRYSTGLNPADFYQQLTQIKSFLLVNCY